MNEAFEWWDDEGMEDWLDDFDPEEAKEHEPSDEEIIRLYQEHVIAARDAAIDAKIDYIRENR